MESFLCEKELADTTVTNTVDGIRTKYVLKFGTTNSVLCREDILHVTADYASS